MWVAGADGCPRGWFRAALELETGALEFAVVATAAELLDRTPSPEVLGIDIPIGLPEAGSRECDRTARRRLGRPRGSSVFPAPIRSALGARSREEASAITQARDGRRVAVQAWAIVPKIRDVDALLADRPGARDRVVEVHPELSFCVWNGDEPIPTSKKRSAGRATRAALVIGWLGRDALDRALATAPRRDLATDDVLDAFAALYTALRIHERRAVTLPDPPEVDAVGLPMRIVC